MPEPIIEEEFTKEELEALGEEEKPSEGEPPETPAEEPPETKPEEEPPPPPEEKPEGEEEPPPEGEKEKVYTQEQVESFVQDRLTRHQKELQETNQQLQERIGTLEKKTETSAPLSVESQDLGRILGDDQWTGWSLNKLKEEGHDDHYYMALGRLGAKQQAEIEFSKREEDRKQEDRDNALKRELQELQKLDASYFDPVTNKPNEKFKELYEWGAENGVYNLLNAHKLKNAESDKAAIEKAAVDKYIKEVTANPSLQRAADTVSTTPTKSKSSMNDTELMEAYDNAVTNEEETEIEKEMEKRGLM